MSGVVALHFWSPTCVPCQQIKPMIEDLKEEFDSVQWVSINTHKDVNGYAAQLNVKVVPTIVLMKNNVEVARHTGTAAGIYYQIFRKALAA